MIIINDKQKKIHVFIFCVIILLNIFFVNYITKSNLHGKFETINIESNYENENVQTEHTRYISEDTIDSLNKKSKWITNKELNKELKEILEKNPKDIPGYDLSE